MLSKLCLIAVLFTLSGCGADFFPAYKRLPTTPDPFSFTSQSAVALNAPITSNAITVSGLTGATSPISVAGPVGANSQFSVNGGAATSSATTVKNGDQVTVTQTSAATLGTSTVATLTIGNVNGTFTVTTQLVTIPSFSAPTQVGSLEQAFTTVSSLDGVVGTHVISIKDALNSINAQYSVGDVNGNPTIFTNATETVAVLNGLRIFVRNLPSTTTTLTIDGVNQIATFP